MKDIRELAAEEQQAHIVKWGGYNDFPPGWKQISEKEFAQSHFFAFTPIYREYRQMIPDRDLRRGPAVSTALYFMHDNVGYAIVNDFWGGKISFFQFGCDHPHANRTVCPKCGFRADYDTSD